VAGVAPARALTIDQFGTLHISAGPLSGQRFVIPKEGLVLGREPGRCAVVLPDDSISKDHAWVVPVDDGVVVIDRGSSNGTYVNSIDSPRISKVLLRSGDRIYLGRSSQTVLTYLR
jgi:pSer/pThr/pTyr-binding forkhead associated (FHA) protein